MLKILEVKIDLGVKIHSSVVKCDPPLATVISGSLFPLRKVFSLLKRFFFLIIFLACSRTKCNLT